MQEIYVIAGGDWLTQTLNAIVTFMSTENWVVIRRIATAFSVLVVAISWIRRHNIMDMLGWAGVIVLMSLLISVRTSVQIIDISNQTKVYKVDNVPVGLALPASLTTKSDMPLFRGMKWSFHSPTASPTANRHDIWGESGFTQYGLFITEPRDNDDIHGLCAELRDGRYFPERKIYHGRSNEQRRPVYADFLKAESAEGGIQQQ